MPDDNTIEFFFSQQNLSGTIGDSDIVVTAAAGNVITSNPTLSPSSLSGGTGVVSGSYVFGTNLANDSDKFPCTVTVTKDGLTDSFKVFAISGGADGTSGTDAITVIVSNESHTLAADANGSVSSYAGAETDVTIFEGVTDKTNTYFINGAGSTDVTIDNDFNSFNSSSVNITNMGHDSGSVTITAISGGIHHSGWGSRAGENWATSQFNINPNGDINGTDNDWFFEDNPDTTIVGTGDGELYNNYVEFGNNAGNDRVWIIGKDIVAYDDTKTYYVEARFKRVAGSGTVYIGANGWSSESNKKNKTGGNSFGSQHYIAANGFTFSENEGTDWVTKRGYFTGHSTNGNSNTGEAPDINTPKSINTAAIYISPMFLAGYGAAAGKVRVDYIVIKEVKDGSGNLSNGVVKIDKTMSLVKSRAGTDGTPGAAGSGSKTVSLTATTNVVTYDADGLNPSPAVMSPITLTANTQNFTNAYFKFTGDFNGLQSGDSQYTDGIAANQDTFSWNTTASYFSSPKTIRVGVSEAADSTTELTFDTVTIAAIKPGVGGADAVTAFLTSEADVVPAANNGDVSSFNGSGTEMFIYEGVTNVSSNYTVTNNNSTGLSATVSNRVLTITALTPDSGSVILTAASGGVSISKTYSIAKSKAGAQGANNQDFSFLDASLSGVTGALGAGLLMNSDVFGYHGAIGSGTAATLSDFTSFLDKDGNFYLGGNASGASNPSDGYLAWNNTNKSLLISGSNANIEVDKFLLGSGTSQYISGSNGNVEIAGDVTFRGRPDNGDGNVVFFDDFSQYSNVAATSGGNEPRIDGTGQGWWYVKGVSTTNSPLLVTDTDCISGKSLIIGNNAGDDEANLLSNQLIPFNESSLYEVEVRIKRTAGTSTTYAYVGINGMQSDGVTKVGYAGNDSTSGHYITLSANNLGTGSGLGYFQTFKGYFKGATRTGTNNGDTSMHDDKTNPGTLRTEINNGFIRAYLLLNYNDTQGITHVDYIKIKEFTSGGTSRISGDSITTGVLKSNNLAADSGSQFKLDDGTFKLGGTDPAYTKLEWDGTDLSVKGNITVSNPGDFADPSLVNDFPDASNLFAHYSLHGKVLSDTGYYRVLDYSGNNRNGNQDALGVSGGTTFVTGTSAGPLPGAAQFDGTDSRISLDTAAIDLTANMDISISFWTKKTTTAGQAVFGIHDGGQNDFIFFIDYGAVNNAIYLMINQTTLGTITSTKEFTNTWRHIGIVAENGAQAKLYVDGEFMGNFTSANVNMANIGQCDEMLLGGELDGATHSDDYTGYISEFRIYNSVLTAANMQSLYNLPTGIPSSTNISGNQISTGKLVSSNWSSTLGTNFDLDGGTFKMGGNTNPKLYWDGTTLAVKGNIEVQGGGFNSTAGELFANPTGHLLASDGRPGGWRCAYAYPSLSNLKSTDLNDGNGKIVEFSRTDSIATHGIVSHALPIEVQQNYKIKLTVKASAAAGSGFYVRIYEYDQELGSLNDGTQEHSVSHNAHNSEPGTVEDARLATAANYTASDKWTYDNGNAVTEENGPLTTSYVNYNATYIPTATAKYFSIVLLHWTNMAAATKIYVKSLNIRKVSQGTTITGAGISTGLLESTNLDADEGSRINLDDGSMIMGGTASPGFEVTEEGFVTATNIVEKFVNVTNANSGSYYQTNSGHTTLVLDGSLGGSVTMNLTLMAAPPYVINDITFPANAGVDDIARLELSIQDDGIQFDDGAITSGYSSFGLSLQTFSQSQRGVGL